MKQNLSHYKIQVTLQSMLLPLLHINHTVASGRLPVKMTNCTLLGSLSHTACEVVDCLGTRILFHFVTVYDVSQQHSQLSLNSLQVTVLQTSNNNDN